MKKSNWMQSSTEWEKLICKELKTETLPEYHLKTEGISWNSLNNLPGLNLISNLPLQKSNDWKIASFHKVVSEKSSNAKILYDLNAGADTLLIETSLSSLNFDELFKGVLFNYIQTYFRVLNDHLKDDLQQWLDQRNPDNFKIEVFNTQLNAFENTKLPYVPIISGFEWNSIGANVVTELTYVINSIEDCINRKERNPIVIEFGVGENTFLEISKFRAFHVLLSCLKEKKGAHDLETIIRSKSGWRNKSIHDPETNQIRQTNEALISIAGGIDELCITPHDFNYIQGPSLLARRMAINVSQLLKYESHLDKFSNIIEGSYIVDSLTQEICDQVWDTIQNKIESKDLQAFLLQKTQETVSLRKKEFEEKDFKLIGMNVYNSNPSKQGTRITLTTSFGQDYFYYENC